MLHLLIHLMLPENASIPTLEPERHLKITALSHMRFFLSEGVLLI